MKYKTINFSDIKDNNFILSPKYYMGARKGNCGACGKEKVQLHKHKCKKQF
jgi:hypothetical protein